MKAQMKFQKILSLVTLIIAAVVFVYAICFFSGNFGEILKYHSVRLEGFYAGADVFIDNGQSFVDTLEILAIVYLVVIAVSYIMGNNSRRNYYITNYVSIAVLVAMTLVVALYGIISLAILTNAFYNKVDWAGMKTVQDVYGSFKPVFQKDISKSPAIFIIGFVIFFIVILSALVWVFNLIWKIKLMKGEKALLEQGFEKEVA